MSSCDPATCTCGGEETITIADLLGDALGQALGTLILLSRESSPEIALEASQAILEYITVTRS